MKSNDSNDNKKGISGSPERQGSNEASSNDQSPFADSDSKNGDNANMNNQCSPSSCLPRKKSFSPVRGCVDDEENFEYIQAVNNSNKNDNNNKTRFPLSLPVATSDDSDKANSVDDYDQEEEGVLDRNKNGKNGTTQSKAMADGGMMVTSTTPANLYDSQGPGLTDPMYANVPKRNNSNSDSDFRGRSESKLFVRHLTRASVLIGDEDAEDMSPALKRRLRDFRFAQRKRKDRYGEQNPWGIIGLYDHLTGIRTDIEWAEDAAWRRENDHPYLSWQDFEEAKDTGFNQPFFTYFTMFVCTVCLVVSFGLNDWTVESLTTNPMIGPSPKVLIQMGAKVTPKIVDESQWYRIFTAMFLHAGIIHFVLNMLALWFIGYAVEQSHGFFAAGLLFILPAVGGMLFSALFLPEFISVGASGGIFGLIGACLADIISNWGLLFSKHVNENNEGQRFRHVKVLIWLVLDIILNVIIGLTPFVDNFTHMGGMFFGFFCGLSTMERLSKAFFGVKTNWLSRVETFVVRFFGIIFSVICIIASFIALASLRNGAGFKCRGCRYISCVSFPFWETENKWWYCDDCNKLPVRAQLYKDTISHFYTQMDLTCPDNSTIFNITLTDNPKNKDFVISQLSAYCRQECDVLYSN